MIFMYSFFFSPSFLIFRGSSHPWISGYLGLRKLVRYI